MKKMLFCCLAIMLCLTACSNQKTSTGSNTSVNESSDSSVSSQLESSGSSSDSSADETIETMKYEGRLGIVLEDTEIQKPYTLTVNSAHEKIVDYSVGEQFLKANDLVVVYSEDGDNCKIATISNDAEPILGTIESKYVSFDEELFSTANQGLLDNKKYYDAKNGNEIGSDPATRCMIESREDGWAQIVLAGHGESVWVKEEDLSYDFDTTVQALAE